MDRHYSILLGIQPDLQCSTLSLSRERRTTLILSHIGTFQSTVGQCRGHWEVLQIENEGIYLITSTGCMKEEKLNFVSVMIKDKEAKISTSERLFYEGLPNKSHPHHQTH